MAGLVATLAVALLVAPPDAVGSGDRRVGLVPISFSGAMSGPDRAALDERFASGLRQVGYGVEPIPGADAQSCTEAACYGDVARSHDVPGLITATVSTKNGDHRVQAALYDAETGREVAEVDEVCELCGVAELGDFLGSVAARLRQRADLAASSPVLVVHSKPAGADVTIDGEPAGQTPLEVPVAPGTHRVEITKAGHRQEVNDIDLEPGAVQTLSFRLARRAAVPAWIPWTALGVGAGLLAGGIAMLAIDGRPIHHGCNPDVDGRCEYLHSTLAGGIVLTAGGAALIGTGIGLAIYRGRQQARSSDQNAATRRAARPVARIGARVGLRGVVISGRF